MRLCILAILFTLSLATQAQEASQAEYEAKLEALKANISKLQKELKSVKGSRDSLQNELQKSETDISDLIKKIERIKGELNEQREQLEQLNEKRSGLKDAQRRQQQQIASQINASYRLGLQSNLKLLLNQEDPARVSRMLRYYDYFLDARADKINTYLDTIAELNQIEPRIKKKAEQLDDNRQQLQQRHQQLAEKQKQRQQTLARLDQSVNSKDQELKKLAQDRANLERLLQEVAEAVATVQLPGNDQPFANLRGKMPWPIKGKITHSFGSARAAGKLKWNGVMISAAAGTEVAAIHYGRVVFSDYLRGHGLLLILDHGSGYMSLYAHNQTLYKETGDWVQAGEIIANVGTSGGLSQAGLYFEIRHNGQPTNPANWCRV